MAGLIDQFRYQVRMSDTLQRLIGVNVIVFVFLRFTNVISTLFLHPVLDLMTIKLWLAIPSSPTRLITHPWTPFTYMFVHWDFFHLLFNMLWLYWFGRIMKEFLGAPKLLATYLLGGLAGGILYMIAYNTLPFFASQADFSFAIGASACTMAITIATATLLPDYTLQLMFFGPVKLKWIALVTLLLDFINLSGGNAGGHIAHLGGALYGYLFIVMLRNGTDISAWLQKLLFRKRNPSRSWTINRSTRGSDEDYVKKRKDHQERLDEILDKIGKSGYESLSASEKEFLFKASKEE